MAQLEWERVQETYGGGKPDPRCSTYRAKVDGGWLVSVWAAAAAVLDAHASKTENHTYGGGLTFVPDPMHRWAVDKHDDQ